MSTVIASPGVQFNEVDLTFSTRTTNANVVYLAGYALQGPIYEPTYVTSLPEFELLFGAPSNSAERYMYHSARQILTKTSSQLLVTRLPYDIVTIDDKALTRSVLVYPLSTNQVDSSTGRFDIAASTEYNLLEPTNIVVEESIYSKIIQHGVDWSDLTIDLSADGYPANPALTAAPIGLIITNNSGTAVNNIFEGNYIGIADNTSVDPSLGFNCITGIKTISTTPTLDMDITSISLGSSIYSYDTWQVVDNQRLSFEISAPAITSGTKDTISEIVLKFPKGYPFATEEFDDSLIVTVFNLKKSIYETTNVQLANILSQGNMGSVNYNKTRVDSTGGSAKSVFLESLINKPSSNVSIFVNTFLSRQDWEDTTTPTVTSRKKIRVHNRAKNLYAIGTYNTINSNDLKKLGNVPGKLQIALNSVDSTDFYPIDITCDAGLSTIWTNIICKNDTSIPGAMPSDTTFQDEELLGTGLVGGPKINDLFGRTGGSQKDKVVNAHSAILSIYESFAVSRKDHIHISDPLRYIFIEGPDFKKTTRKSDSVSGAFNFYNEIYWPLYHLYSSHATSYVATYPNWFAVADGTMRKNIWVPPSGVVAANIINTSPVEAPAGFTRGNITGIADSAMSPNQKQRDQLYKISQNPISVFPGEGTVIFGQKTLLNKPSAFDRLNVRRTFIFLEKATNTVLKYFVFEPNTYLVRNRVTNTLKPIYEQTKNAGGIYDYRIVCDERNNTPATIDANELHVDVYVKPTRTAEFILVNFYATRTDQNFNELISAT